MRGDLTALQLAVPAVDPVLAGLVDVLPPGSSLLAPGHVSFGYPWLPPDGAAAQLPVLAATLVEQPPLEVVLEGPRTFPADERGRTVVYVCPEPVDAVGRLLDTVARAVGRPPGSTPHCSLARLPAGADVEAVLAHVRPALPLATTLDTVELRVRHGGTWRVERRLRLAGAASD